jgi:hypothetical protein
MFNKNLLYALKCTYFHLLALHSQRENIELQHKEMKISSVMDGVHYNCTASAIYWVEILQRVFPRVSYSHIPP